MYVKNQYLPAWALPSAKSVCGDITRSQAAKAYSARLPSPSHPFAAYTISPPITTLRLWSPTHPYKPSKWRHASSML